MSVRLIEQINAVDTAPRPKASGPSEIVSRLTESPFAVSEDRKAARAAVIAELRHDADVRDAECDALAKQIASLSAEALAWRNTADHLEQNPP